MKQVRLALAIAGFLVALLSVALDNRQLGWGAIALLTSSLILRLLLQKRQDRRSGGEGL